MLAWSTHFALAIIAVLSANNDNSVFTDFGISLRYNRNSSGQPWGTPAASYDETPSILTLNVLSSLLVSITDLSRWFYVIRRSESRCLHPLLIYYKCPFLKTCSVFLYYIWDNGETFMHTQVHTLCPRSILNILWTFFLSLSKHSLQTFWSSL